MIPLDVLSLLVQWTCTRCGEWAVFRLVCKAWYPIPVHLLRSLTLSNPVVVIVPSHAIPYIWNVHFTLLMRLPPEGPTIHAITTFRNLHRLSLYEVVMDQVWEPLSRLDQLHTLKLEECRYSKDNPLLQCFQLLVSLRSIHIHSLRWDGTRERDLSIEPSSNDHLWVHLRLQFNQMNNVLHRYFLQNTHLEYLVIEEREHLSYVKSVCIKELTVPIVSVDGFQSLAHMHQLEKLRLTDYPILPVFLDDFREALRENVPYLRCIQARNRDVVVLATKEEVDLLRHHQVRHSDFWEKQVEYFYHQWIRGARRYRIPRQFL